MNLNQNKKLSIWKQLEGLTIIETITVLVFIIILRYCFDEIESQHKNLDYSKPFFLNMIELGMKIEYRTEPAEIFNMIREKNSARIYY